MPPNLLNLKRKPKCYNVTAFLDRTEVWKNFLLARMITAKAKKSENQTVILPKPCNIVTYTYFYKKYYYYYVDFIQLFPSPTPNFLLHTSSVTCVTSVTFFPLQNIYFNQ